MSRASREIKKPTPRYFATAAEFRAWLEKNGAREPELWIGFYRTASGRTGLTYKDALDEALCAGWIDGLLKSVDAHSYMQRFTPRRRGSIWSMVNTKRVRELIALGRMRDAGLRAFEARDPKRSGIYGHERKPMQFDAASAKLLAADRAAKAFFDAQPPGYRRLMTYWVMSAKKEETRRKRLAKLIATSACGKRIDFMKPTT
jgi:uncharacterized protein YdeI (YjbR/CyaY-like superfamily)